MKDWKKILTIMLAAMSAVYLLTGCSGVGAVASTEMNTVSIKKDGTIEQLIVDQFDKDYYNIDELAAKAQNKIENFSDGVNDIVLESAEENSGKVVVKITYNTGEDYTQYNRRDLFYGTVAEASAQGFSVRNIYAEDGTEMDDTKQIWDNHVVFIQTKKGEELDVNVYDKVLYTSANVTWSGKNDVIITAGEGDMISCIVFK